jgi:hypothetical protein
MHVSSSLGVSEFNFVNPCPQNGFRLAIVILLPRLGRFQHRGKVKQKRHVTILLKIKHSPFEKLPLFCTHTLRQHSSPSHTRLIFTGSTSCSEKSSAQSTPPCVFFTHRGSSDGRSTPLSYTSLTAPPPSNYFVPGQPRIRISSLLSDPQSTSYHLEVIQHPQKTAEFGTAILSRLPLTPPIIVRLTIKDPTGNIIFPEEELPFLVAHLSLFTGDGETSLDMAAAPDNQGGDDQEHRRLLCGNLVSSAQLLEDLQGHSGLFFLFSDVSIRWRGRFQLGVTLLRLSSTDPSGATRLAERGDVLAQARTHPFDVLPHDEYTAAPTTRLTLCFLRQGVVFRPSMFSS